MQCYNMLYMHRVLEISCMKTPAGRGVGEMVCYGGMRPMAEINTYVALKSMAAWLIGRM